MDDHPASPQQPRTIPVCYRHPDRQTRLSCSSCGRPVCVDCVQQASVGQKCPECARPHGRNRVITATQIRERRATDGAPFTAATLAITIGIAAIGFFAPAAWVQIRDIFIHNVALVDAGEWWRIVTAALLHSRALIFHVAFNMWALYVLGPELERQVGSLSFGLFYVATAAAGGAAYQALAVGGSALGASGAVFGLFGAWVVAAFRARHTSTGRANLNQMLILLGVNLALPLFLRGIAWQAHLGGLLAGMLIAMAWTRLRDNELGRAVVPVVVLAASVASVALL